MKIIKMTFQITTIRISLKSNKVIKVIRQFWRWYWISQSKIVRIDLQLCDVFLIVGSGSNQASKQKDSQAGQIEAESRLSIMMQMIHISSSRQSISLMNISHKTFLRQPKKEPKQTTVEVKKERLALRNRTDRFRLKDRPQKSATIHTLIHAL